MVTKLNLNSSQVTILQCLKNYPDGLSRDSLERLSGANCNAGNLGPVFRETLPSYPECLWSYGLVRAEMYYDEDKQDVWWFITEEGERIAERARTKRTSTYNGKIPYKYLDPPCKEMMKRVTYSFERYTADDLDFVRSMIPDEYRGITDDDLIEQMANRRKQGAYKQERKVPQWYVAYRDTPEFKDRVAECLERWGGACAVNVRHTSDITVVHRTFTFRVDEEDGGGEATIIDREQEMDLIPLCEKCLLRLQKSLELVPEEQPNPYE